MKIVIAGMGGIGGLLAGKLAPVAPDLVCYCRGRTLEAIRSRGLELRSPSGTAVVQPNLVTDCPQEIGRADAVFFTVKNYSLAQAAQELGPVVGPQTAVIPLENGVSAPEELAQTLPQGDVLGGCIYVSSFIVEPGVIQQASPLCRVLFGKPGLSQEANEERYGALRDLLASALEVQLTDKIQVAQWDKFLMISVMATVSTYYQATCGEILANPQAMAMVGDLADEVAALAQAKAIALTGHPREVMKKSLEAFPPETKTSMQRDFEYGGPTELESLTGYVCREARRLAVAVPNYDKAYQALVERIR